MRKSDKSEGGRKAGDAGQLWLRLPGLVGEALYETVIGVGLACVDEALEAERAALCGARYVHRADRQALRAGHLASSLALGGRRVAVSRPRVRSVEGRELKLPSWQEWSARDPLDQRALEQMVLGVSTRRYARSLEPLPQTVQVRGVSKSAVSDRFVYGTERKLAELMSRNLRGLALVALMIDGVHFGEHVVLAAVGVDERGGKQVLGLREGATENAAAVKVLLADLVERGLDPNRSLLIVIDGARALHKAVVEVFGRRALIQRCREHKKRNVSDALPERHRAPVRSTMNQAYATRDAGRARRLLDNLARRLRASASRRRRLAARGTGRNSDGDALGAARESRTGAVLHQLDRESVQPGARDRTPGQTLAERHHGAALDCGRRARGRARLPQARRLSCDSDPGRCPARPRCTTRSC